MLRKVVSGGQTGVDRAGLDAEEIIKPEHVVRWIEGQLISTLNVAGPRESKYPGGIYAEAFAYLELVFALIRDTA